jgi:Flp pilus assembly protein TadB
MDRRPTTRGGAQKNKRRLITFLWIAGLAVLTIALIYFEQVAILYLLATLGLTALLVVVALSDLHGRKGADDSELGDDAAAIGSGITAATVSAGSSPASAARRSAAKRR